MNAAAAVILLIVVLVLVWVVFEVLRRGLVYIASGSAGLLLVARPGQRASAPARPALGDAVPPAGSRHLPAA